MGCIAEDINTNCIIKLSVRLIRTGILSTLLYCVSRLYGYLLSSAFASTMLSKTWTMNMREAEYTLLVDVALTIDRFRADDGGILAKVTKVLQASLRGVVATARTAKTA